MQLPPTKKKKIYVHAHHHFRWNKNTIYTISSTTQDGNRKWISGTTNEGWSLPKQLLFLSTPWYSTGLSYHHLHNKKGHTEAQRPSLTHTKLSGALSCITCPEDTVQKTSSTSALLQLCHLVDSNTVSNNKSSNIFFAPEMTFRIFYTHKITFCK